LDAPADNSGEDRANEVIRGAISGLAEADEVVFGELKWLVRLGPRNQALRCRALLAAAAFTHRRGKGLEHGLEASIVATSIAANHKLFELEVKCRIASGNMMHALGNPGGAVESFVLALDGASQLSDRLTEQKLFNNIANACTVMGLYTEASRAYTRAIDLASGNGSEEAIRSRGETLANVAYCARLQMDVETGLDAIVHAVGLMGEPRTARDKMARCFAESTYCRLLLLAGRSEEARDRASVLSKLAAESGSLRADMLCRGVDALVRAHRGDPAGAAFIIRGLIATTRNVSADALQEHLDLAIEVADAGGDVETRVEYLRELASMRLAEQRSAAIRLAGVERALLNASDADPEVIQLAGDSWAMLEWMALVPDVACGRDAEHMFRVGRLTYLLASEMGMAPDVCNVLERAARLHDIGNAAVPEVILRKPSRLTSPEMDIARLHADAGAQIISAFDAPGIAAAERIARHHHERWSGDGGYPHGLHGEAIPLEARMVAIADRLDTLTHKRPYASAVDLDAALIELKLESGASLDPALTDTMVGVVSRLRSEHQSLDDFLSVPAAQSRVLAATMTVREALRRTVT